MSTTRALFTSPAARRALVDGRTGAVELVLSAGVCLRLGREWLTLVQPSAPFGPLSLVVHGLEWLELAPGSPVRVSGRRLMVGEYAISLERMRERRMTPLGSAPPAGAHAITAAAAAALAALPDPPASLERGIAALVVGRVREAVHALAGIGEGLTPAGDDVLSGYAAWLSALRAVDSTENPTHDEPIQLSALAGERSSALGLAYLRCAERGELPDAGAQLLVAIRSGSGFAVHAVLPRLRAWGASSGIALAWGIAAGVRGSILLASTSSHHNTNGSALTARAPAEKP